MTAHGALLGAVPYPVKAIPLIAFITFCGWKISGLPGAVASLLTGVTLSIGMTVAPTVNDKATVAEWVLSMWLAGMLAADFLPGSRR